ncbi:hypothetical protein TOL_3317 [Thalassolituus oleivorans MIL-1]|uniref:Uncharacterized protein n=1 Tax=Thalassolituus oleivorans MIL-1 TaxID=1298593 RepID=M5DW90_9GAMM|nr:hypothetical protein TOL_3317 [Thalassolituus oleivorans MIL-1]
MTTYRLLNNVNKFHEALVDFREMRRQKVTGPRIRDPQPPMSTSLGTHSDI